MKSAQPLLKKAIPVLVLIGMCIGFAVLEPRFASTNNFIRIATAAAIPLLIALGVTFTIQMGSIDLSAEGALAFSAAVTCTFVANASGFGVSLGLASIPIILLFASLFGLIVGAVHVYLNVPSFMASLGMGFVGIGATTLYLGGERIPIIDQSFRALTLERFLGVPFSVYIAGAAVGFCWYIQSHTRLGRHILALGGGEDLARASGINTGRVRILAFGLAGALYGLASILLTAKLGFGSALSGSGQLFTAISAVVVGGTALTGGNGGALFTLVGVLIITTLNNGMIVLGLPSYIQQGVIGAAIIVALLINSTSRAQGIVK